MKKYFLFSLIFLVWFIGFVPFAHAHCPICTAAVGAAAISAKYYGMDTSIIGLFIGAFAVSTGLWIGLKIKKRFFRFQLAVIVLLSFLLTVIPLMGIDSDSVYMPMLFFGTAGSILNKVYWVNKLLFGSIIGAIVSLIAYFTHNYIKKANGNVLFPFQGTAITIIFLGLSGLALYFNFA